MRRKLLALFAVAAAACAQKFEVASVKANHAADPRVMIQVRPGGRFVTENTSLKMLLAFAYGVKQYQLTGLPGWAESDRYDINAKAENVTPEEAAPMTKMPSQTEMEERQKKLRAMLQDLLADRFGLKVHRETKEMPVYALVVAKGGTKLLASNPDAPPLVEPPPGRGGDSPKPPFRASLMRMGPGGLTAQELDMPALAGQLSQILGRTVIDKTGLTGKYDLKLTWTPDQPPQGLPPGDAPPPATENGPSLFTAIQEQLGLKLDSTRGPVELIVIDHVEKPSEN